MASDKLGRDGPYASPYLKKLFLDRHAAAMARRYDDIVGHWIERGMDLASARDMADASVRYDWFPSDQSEFEDDAERARGEWTVWGLTQ